MDNQSPVPPDVNVQEIIRKGEEIYLTSLKNSLEPSNNGKYVAIEVESGKHFVADTKDDAVLEARKEFQDKILYTRKIGEVEKISSYSPSFSPDLQYDWLL